MSWLLLAAQAFEWPAPANPHGYTQEELFSILSQVNSDPAKVNAAIERFLGIMRGQGVGVGPDGESLYYPNDVKRIFDIV